MIDYELIYERKQHYLTIPQDNNRKLCFGNEKGYWKRKKKNTIENIRVYVCMSNDIIPCIINDWHIVCQSKNIDRLL